MTTPIRLPFARYHNLPELCRSALILVDLQQVFTSPEQPAFILDTREALRQACLLIDAFRQAGRPIVYTRHAHLTVPQGAGMGSWWSHFVMEGTAGSELDPRLSPTNGELVIRKEHYSALFGTSLEEWLHRNEIETLVLCGTMTHICVDTTARDAFMRGFNVVVVSDACASKHQSLHESALLGLSHAVARVCTTSTLIDQVGEEH